MTEVYRTSEEYIFKAEFDEDRGLMFFPTGESVVRCKDCRWYNEGDLFCRYWAVLYAHADTTPRYSPVDYCFRGIRKEVMEK